MIRNAALTDLPAIRQLLAELDYDPPANIQARLQQLLNHPDEILLVYELDGRVVSLLSLHFIPQLALAGDFARISYFVVDETVRGKNIGREMEAHIAALARERNCDRIEVHCHSRRTDAHRFYEGQGFVESPKYFIKPLP